MACNCIGPPGNCPCIRNGPAFGVYAQNPMGCVCPPESEKTCQGIACPRLPPVKQKLVNGELVWAR